MMKSFEDLQTSTSFVRYIERMVPDRNILDISNINFSCNDY